MTKIIDLRSDTVTLPTQAMRTAMAQAEVGDDVLNEDPTIHKLQSLAAQKIGKEAALFIPSGTMGNLVSLLSHCSRGDEVILGDQSHIFLNEVGGISALGGIQPRILPNLKDGTIDLDAMESAVRKPELHFPSTRLICIEKTQNYCTGAPLSKIYMDSVFSIAQNYHLKIHLDGARIFNAAVALSIDVKELTCQANSVMFCLSKGLSAPVGSLICGSKGFIQRAIKFRKMTGGGMRQAGHLAAAGIIALEELTDRLKEDHDNAKLLATGLSTLPGIKLDPDLVQTNIIFFRLNHPAVNSESFLSALDSEGVKLNTTAPGVFRMVLHREVTQNQAQAVLEIIQSILN